MTDAAPTRRSFLTLLGLAPIAAAAVSAAAMRPANMRLLRGSTAYLGQGRRILLSDEVDPHPWSATEIADYRRTRLMTWPNGPEKDQVDREWSDFMRQRIALQQSVRHVIGSSPAPCPILIDDVGSGP